jgi:hypothetical protein
MLVFAASLAAIAVTTMSIQAQSSGARVHIPFAFHAGDTILPAGDYTMRMQKEAFRIADKNGHAAIVLCNTARNEDMQAGSRLVFKGLGDSWILTQVRWQDYGAARDLIQTPYTELELAKSTAQRVVPIPTR